MKWLRQTTDYQCPTTTDDVISGQVTISGDRSTSAMTERNKKRSLIPDNSNDVCVGEMPANDTETIPGREIGSSDVVAGEVENQCDDMLSTTDDVTTQDRSRAHTGDIQVCCIRSAHYFVDISIISMFHMFI